MPSSSLFINLVDKIAKPINVFIIGLYFSSFTFSIGFVSELFLLSFTAFKVMLIITIITFVFWAITLLIRHVIDEFAY